MHVEHYDHPFPHIIIKEFLQKDKAEEVEKALRKESFTRKDADLFSFSQTGDLHASKDKTIKEFLKFLCSKEFNTKVTEITRIATKPGKVDAAGFIYGAGDYLLCHDDGVSSRKIAYIYNLSKNFTTKDGGALCLFSADGKNRPTKIIKRITPSWNTLILFPVTRRSHHQVEEVLSDKQRLTITGWFHA